MARTSTTPEKDDAADSKSDQSYAEGGQQQEDQETPKSNLLFVLSVLDGYLKKFKASSHTVDS